MKKRNFNQLMTSKAIYRKHAARHKANDYPSGRCKRMMAYTSLLTKAIAKTSERG
ncbi:hypothetical protein [Metasolibacillus meyeri]|uniref:hypothetical protein n=1 Tax=Metasolibacillus meyeri TaxID=1071052 RepID=UPI00187D5EB0|nr:hypothetical protein [Metasolibacillus meyeri]